MELQPASRFDWERTVRRCMLPGPVKLVAYTLAQYGDVHGQNIRPGTPRLAVVCGISTRVVERHVSTLRELGLLLRVRNGGGPRKLAAEYRLTVPSDIFDRIEMLDPAETPASQKAVVRPPHDTGTPAVQVAGVPLIEGDTTPATYAAGVVDATPVDNQATPATHKAGVAEGPDEELPPSATELPPFPARTPANDPPLTCNDAHHQPSHQPSTPTSRSPKSLRRLRDQRPRADPENPPLDPDAERHRQQSALHTWTAAHPEAQEAS